LQTVLKIRTLKRLGGTVFYSADSGIRISIFDMDLWQLNIFCKVIEEKSFSGAGKRIHLSQPTVSSHIRDLETHFGGRLVDRFAREALPTKAGEIVYEYAKKMIALRDEMETRIAEFHGSVRGTLAIGGSTIPGVHILPKIIGSFIETHPEVKISMIIGDTEEIVDAILSGRVELGIVGAKTRNARIFQEKLLDDEMRLIVPATHNWANRKRVRLEMLGGEPFIARESGSGTLETLRRSLEKTGFALEDLNIVAEMGSTGAVIQGIKNGIGLSILSPIAVAEDIEAGTLRALSITGLNLKRHFYLTRHKDRTASPLCNAFEKFLKSLFPK